MSTNQPDPELRKLYPSLSDQELIVAEEKLTEYLGFALRVCNRIRRDPAEYAGFREMVEAVRERHSTRQLGMMIRSEMCEPQEPRECLVCLKLRNVRCNPMRGIIAPVLEQIG